MKSENFYAVVIILLLLLNFATIGYLLISDNDQGHNPPPDRHHSNAEQIIVNELNLNEEQVRQFRGYKRQHGKATDSVQRQIKNLQRELFSLVKAEEMDIKRRDSLLIEIEQCESAKHLITIEHFHDLRSMMQPEQVELFNGFIEEMGSRIIGPGRPPHGGPPPHRRH